MTPEQIKARKKWLRNIKIDYQLMVKKGNLDMTLSQYIKEINKYERRLKCHS